MDWGELDMIGNISRQIRYCNNLIYLNLGLLPRSGGPGRAWEWFSHGWDFRFYR